MSRSSNAEKLSAPESFDLNNKSPIDEDDLKVQALSGPLQGDILKGHGREFSVHIFFSFRDDIPAVRRQLAELTRQYAASALRQYHEARKFKASATPGGLFGNLFSGEISRPHQCVAAELPVPRLIKYGHKNR
jgi:hypothetical protein